MRVGFANTLRVTNRVASSTPSVPAQEYTPEKAAEHVEIGARTIRLTPSALPASSVDPALDFLATAPVVEEAVEAVVQLTAAAFERTHKRVTHDYVAAQGSKAGLFRTTARELQALEPEPEEIPVFRAAAQRGLSQLKEWHRGGHFETEISWDQMETNPERIFMVDGRLGLRPEPSDQVSALMEGVTYAELHGRLITHRKEIPVRPEIRALGSWPKAEFSNLIAQLIEQSDPEAERRPLYVLNEILRAAQEDPQVADRVSESRKQFEGLASALESHGRNLYDEHGGRLIMSVYNELVREECTPGTLNSLQKIAASPYWQLQGGLHSMLGENPRLEGPVLESILAGTGELNSFQDGQLLRALSKGYSLSQSQAQNILDRIFQAEGELTYRFAFSHEKLFCRLLERRDQWPSLNLGPDPLIPGTLKLLGARGSERSLDPEHAFRDCRNFKGPAFNELILQPEHVKEIEQQLQGESPIKEQAAILGYLFDLSLTDEFWAQQFHRFEIVPDSWKELQSSVSQELEGVTSRLNELPEEFFAWATECDKLKVELKETELPWRRRDGLEKQLKETLANRWASSPELSRLEKAYTEPLNVVLEFGQQNLGKLQGWLAQLDQEHRGFRSQARLLKDRFAEFETLGNPESPAAKFALSLLPFVSEEQLGSVLQVSKLENIGSLGERISGVLGGRDRSKIDLLLRELPRCVELPGGATDPAFIDFVDLLAIFEADELAPQVDKLFQLGVGREEFFRQVLERNSVREALSGPEREVEFKVLEDGLLIGDTLLSHQG